MSRKFFAASLILIAVVLGCTKEQNPGTVAEDFNLQDLNGRNVNLSDFRGKPVLLDFWASWCPPCREAIPMIEKLHKSYSPKGLVVLGISADNEGWDSVKSFVAAQGMTYIILKGDDDVLYNYRVRTIPLLVLVNKEGEIVKRYLGFGAEEELEKDIQSVL